MLVGYPDIINTFSALSYLKWHTVPMSEVRTVA